MTARLGDQRSTEMVRAHDAIVRRALKDALGREVKHTGDGIMATFDEADRAVSCSRSIQSGIDAFNMASAEKLNLRIGMDAGEPVAENDDLFGSTVQLAARLTAAADADTTFVTQAIRDLAPTDVRILERGNRELKGFSDPVPVFEVAWR